MAEQPVARRGASPRSRWRPLLRGRARECELLDAQLRQVAVGQSAVLVLRGEAGIGKSALLEYAAEQASGWCRVLRAAGVQSEMELTYAGLHQLCAVLLDRIQDLPVPQRDALRVAFGLQEGRSPQPFAVALAVLGLLSGAVESKPVVCIVDDAQWLDRASAQALAFVARRLLAERIVMMFAVREPSDVPELAGLPDLLVDGLADRDARLLLASGLPGRLDKQVRDRIIAETRGNPLALLELPRGMTLADLAGGFGQPDSASVAGRIEDAFATRVASLPADARLLLLLAAAEPLGDVPLMWRAAQRLGIAAAAAQPAEAAGLVEIGIRVQFRHPLVRSAVYRSAAPSERQRVHAALAEATDVDADTDRYAWHRAHATVGLDETVAAELETSAGRAKRRGGAAAAAAFLQRSAELTPEPGRRGARALAAAEAKIEAAAPAAASALLDMAELCPLDDYDRARCLRLHAQVALARSRGRDALPLLLDAARNLAPFGTGLARETRLEAFAAAIYAGRTDDAEVQQLAKSALAAPATDSPPDPVESLTRGLAIVFTEGFVAGVPRLQEALEEFRRADEAGLEVDRWLWLADRIAFDLWDDQLSEELASRDLRRAREAGALDILPIATSFRAGVHVHAGEFAAASALLQESAAITQLTGTAALVYATPVLAAYQGDETRAVALLDAAAQDAAARGQAVASSMIGCARATLCNALGRYDEALSAAAAACTPRGLGLYPFALVEQIEAAARIGQPERARAALDRLGPRAGASGTDWALGMAARSRALLSEGPAAEADYDEAVTRLSRGRAALHLARARLVYGEWLRRQNRRLDARRQLRAAHDFFDEIGAEAFAERARRELVATGETARRRTVDTLNLLTAQEAQIAQLAADGLSNPEIGGHLFISSRTVEYHLRKVFAKLDVSARKELKRALAGAPGPATGVSD